MSFDSFEYKTTSEYAESVKAGAINLDEAQGIVECFVAGIGNKDSVGDIVISGAFTKSLMRRKPRVVWGHNWNDPIGKVLEIYEVGPNDRRLPLKMKMAGIGGLFAKVQFNLQSEKGREAFANVAFFGEEQEWSIGYKTIRAQYDQKSQANIIHELELYEVSPVLHGANQLTGTISVKADDPYAGGVMEMPVGPPRPAPAPGQQMTEMVKMMEQQLSEMFGAKISVTEVDDQNVVYSRMGTNGTTEKFKCPYMHDGHRFMFGAPKPVPVAIVMPPSVPSVGTPPNDPRRIVRPQQMPAIPVAIKPGAAGMVMVPLPPVQYENSKPSGPIDKNNLDTEEADLRDALLKIVKRHGKFNEDSEGVWAGYKPAAENYVAKIGVKCANCVFYEGGTTCKIIAMQVEPEGKCRFAVIPKGVVLGDSSATKQYELENESDEEDYVDELEVKYPGELAVAALRGVVGRRRKKRRKYKLLSEFGKDTDQEEKGYVIPVHPEQAFKVKQLLDPIFDYHRVESFVDIDGIVVKSGASFDLIEAVDNALQNIKKKDESEGIEQKAIGYRIGRSIGSRLVDRPNVGGGRGRRDRRSLGRNRADIPTGGIAGFRDPTGSNFDPDRDGWVDEGTTRPRFIGVPGDKPETPGKRRGAGSGDGEFTPQPNRRDQAGRRLDPRGRPISEDPYDAGPYISRDEEPGSSTRLMSNLQSGLSSGDEPAFQSREIEDRLASRLANRNVNRHGLPGENSNRLDPLEKQNRERHDKMARNWLESGLGWIDIPRDEGDRRHGPDYLRGQELGANHARLSWDGGNSELRGVAGSLKKPIDFEDNAKDDREYIDWFAGHVLRMGSLSQKVRNRENEESRRRMSNDEVRGFLEAVREDVDSRVPEGRKIDPDENRRLRRIMDQFGFGDGLASGESLDDRIRRPGAGMPRERRVPDVYGDDFDPDNPMGDDGTLFDQSDVDMYELILDSLLGPEERTPPFRQRRGTGERRSEQDFDPDSPFAGAGDQTPEDEDEGFSDVDAEIVDDAYGKGTSTGLSSGQVKARASYVEYLNTPPNRRSKRDRLKYDGAAEFGLSSGKDKKGGEKTGEMIPVNSEVIQQMYDALLDQILQAMEEAIASGDPAKWKKGWISLGGIKNAYTGQPYSGFHNILQLAFVSNARGYDVPRWAGEVQWRRWAKTKYGIDIGPLDPSRAVAILRPIKDRESGATIGFEEERVWNVAEVPGIPADAFDLPEMNSEQALQDLENIIQEVGPVVKTVQGGDKAAYYPGTDHIVMPAREQFLSNLEYYSTLFHEATHWTGHKSRNDRHDFITNPQPGSKIFGSPEYAFEELIAEIGSSIALSFMGVETEIDKNHIEYLKGWLSVLKNDRGKLREALKQAEEAVDFFLWKSERMRELVGINEATAQNRRDAFERRKRGLPDVDVDELPKYEEPPYGVYYPEDIANVPGLSSGQKRGIANFSALTAEEKRIYDPLGKTQRTPDGRRYDVLNGLSSGKEAEPIMSVDRKDGKERISITPTPNTPGSISYRELFDLPFDPTEEQTRIVDTVLAHMLGVVRPGIISVKAGAGTSKTTTQKIAMESAQRFADLQELLDNPEKLAQKLEHLQRFLGPVMDGILSEQGFKGKKLVDLPEADRDKVIDALKAYVGSRRAYYTVFSRAMKQEVSAEFAPNTGISTLSQLAYWSLRLGGGEKKYGKGMAKKIHISQQTNVPLRDIKRNGVVVTEGKTRTVTVPNADGVPTTYTGFKPGWRARGYHMLEDGSSIVRYLKEAGIPMKLFYPDPSTGRDQSISEDDLGAVLNNVLRRFAASNDRELTAAHFMPTGMEKERADQARLEGRRMYIGDAPFPSPPQEWVELAQRLWKDISDGESKVLPDQNQLMKLWIESEPDLRSDPGMIDHSNTRNVTFSPDKDSPLAKRLNEHLKGLFGVDESGELRRPDSGELKEAIGDFLNGEILAEGDLDPSKGTAKKKNVGGLIVTSVTVLERADGKYSIRLSLANRFGGTKTPLSLFMIDEAQDMNESMMGVITNNRDRLPIFLVGDTRQQIMGWRGSMDILSGSDPDFLLPLREAFRYGPHIAYVANLPQMLGNMDDEEKLGVNPGEHVRGVAHKVLEKLFNFADLDSDGIAKALITIQKRYGNDIIRLSNDKDDRYSGPFGALPKDDRGVPDLTILARELREIDGDSSKTARRKEILKAISEVGAAMVEDARGQVVIGSDITKKDAILTSTNAGIFEAAIALAERRRLSGNPKTINVTIPARKYDEFVGFMRHMAWVHNQGDGGKIPKPQASSVVGNIWTTQEILNKARSSSAHPSLVTLLAILNNGIAADPSNPAARTTLAPWQWLRLLGDTPGDVDPTQTNNVNVRILREREKINLPGGITHPNPDKRDGATPVTGKDILDLSQKEFKGGVKGSSGEAAYDTRGESLDIIPDDSVNQFNRVFWKLDLDPKGNWSGDIVINGHGVVKPENRKAGGRGMTQTGKYYADLQLVISALANEGLIDKSEIKYEEEAWRQVAAAGKPSPGWRIVPKVKGIDKPYSQLSPEEKLQVQDRAARIVTMVGGRLRQSASRQHGDVQIMTIDTAKGQEFGTVAIWSDFIVPRDPFDWAKATDQQKVNMVAGLVDSLLPAPAPGTRKRWKDALQFFPPGTTEADLKREYNQDATKLRARLAGLIVANFDADPPKFGEKTFREDLNKAYVGISRARRLIDVGANFYAYFMNPAREGFTTPRREILDAHIKDLIDRGIIPKEAGIPDGWVEPELGKTDRREVTPLPEIDKYNVDDIDEIDLGPDDPDPNRTMSGLSSGRADDDYAFRPLDARTRNTVDDTVRALSSGGSINRADVDDAISELGRRMRDAVIARERQGILNRDQRDAQMERLVELGILDESDMNDVFMREAWDSMTPAERDMMSSGRPANMSQEEWDNLVSSERDDYIALVDEVQKASTILDNATWASDTLASGSTSPQQKAAARRILSSETGLSSGRSERRVRIPLSKVRDEMQYDYAAAGSRFPPTAEQRDILDAVMTGEDVVVMALAGTGKTSTLELAARRLRDQAPDKKVLYIVFNKKNQLEAESRFAEYPNVEVRTIDSVAWAGVIGSNSGLRTKNNAQSSGPKSDSYIGQKQYRRLADHYGVDEEVAKAAAKELQAWSNTAEPKSTAAAASSRNRQISASVAAQASDLANRMFADMFDPDSEIAISQNAVMKKFTLSNPDLSTGVGMRRNTTGNDILFFDEAQDSNPSITNLVRSQKLQKIVVGDSNQAIYAFRGSVDEIDKFDAPYRLALTESWRFGSEIAGIGNRFLSAQEKMLEADGTPMAGARFRLRGAGGTGQILQTAGELPPGIFSRENRELKKDGTRETLAILSQTNATAFKELVAQIDEGRSVGIVPAFKKDLDDMIEHLEWLRGGGRGKRKGTFDALLEFETWQQLVDAASPESGGAAQTKDKTQVSYRNVQAITAYRLAKEMQFNFDLMRDYVNKAIVQEEGVPVKSGPLKASTDVINASRMMPGDTIELFPDSPGLVRVSVADGELQIQTKFINNPSDPLYGQIRTIRSALLKRGFSDQPRGSRGGKRLVTPSSSPEEGRTIMSGIAEILNNELSGQSPSPSSVSAPSKVDVRDAKQFSELGPSGKTIANIGDAKNQVGVIVAPTKRNDGKLLITFTGDTFGQKEKIKAIGGRWNGKDKPQTPDGQKPGTWAIVAENAEDAAKKLGALQDDLVPPGTTTASPTNTNPAEVDLFIQTAHRSKGLEFDYVIAAGDFTDGRLIDEKTGELILDDNGNPQLDPDFDPESARLQYVAATRAKKVLVLGGLGWIRDVTSEDDEKYRPTTGLSSGGGSGRRSGPASRRMLSTGREAPFAGGRSRIGEEQNRLNRGTGGRGSRRDAYMGGQGLSSGRGDAASSSFPEMMVADMGGERMSPDREGSARARRSMESWAEFRSRGITLIAADQPRELEGQRKAISSSIDRVGRAMSADPVRVGSTTSNNPQNATPETWMLPVSKLRETLRVPTEFTTERDAAGRITNSRVAQTEQISIDDLGRMLGLSAVEAAKLRQPDAGINQDAVRRLIAELGKQKSFAAFRVFAVPSIDSESSPFPPGYRPNTPAERSRFGMWSLLTAQGRDDMRERFIIETFGKDAFPYWWDPSEGRMLTQDEYAVLGEDAPTAKHYSTGSFSPREYRPELHITPWREDSLLPTEAVEPEVEPTKPAATKSSISKADFPLKPLLSYLGIDENGEWYNELSQAMARSFGVDPVDTGLASPNLPERRRLARKWEREGVPIGVVNEMIRTGLIQESDGAGAIWGDSALDSALLRKKPMVIEALHGFVRERHPEMTLSSVLGLTNEANNSRTYISNAVKTRGRSWSKRNSNESLFSESDMQQMVDRLNGRLGTNYTIEDIFSDERLKAAGMLHSEGKSTLDGSKLDVEAAKSRLPRRVTRPNAAQEIASETTLTDEEIPTPDTDEDFEIISETLARLEQQERDMPRRRLVLKPQERQEEDEDQQEEEQLPVGRFRPGPADDMAEFDEYE